MFDDFEVQTIRLAQFDVRVRIGGSGPPLLLLHGYPQSHVMWHQVAPVLAETRTVVMPDLRGYGGSGLPLVDSAEAYSKRAMASDQVELMGRLGHERFEVIGHDRGGRVGYRLALDHPASISRLTVLDIVPTADMWHAAEKQPADQLREWHWNKLARSFPEPEDEINRDPAGYLFPDGSPAISGYPIELHPEALQDYLAAIANPDVVHAMCQDYRAGATVDRAHDEADLAAGHRITCPVRVYWGERGDLPKWFDVLDVWSRWTVDLDGAGLPGGHFIAEEIPRELLDVLDS
ncbi:alpha/beta fold hydrolase [Kribbella deserti]|uniref:Alpha/beta fold hydrolase n=1 Tax=Kribbella deserti TaxID=1926257 RepID=A0ABV6QRJ3_9ACTN